MIRFVVIALAVVAVWVVLVKLGRMARSRAIDWTGVSFIAGFVVLAFWLRHVTGLG